MRDVLLDERARTSVDEPGPAVGDADDFVTELRRAEDHRADRRVQTRRVATPREHSNAHPGK